MLVNAPIIGSPAAQLNAEAVALETTIAGLKKTLGSPTIDESERERAQRELAGLECKLARIWAAYRHAVIRTAMS